MKKIVKDKEVKRQVKNNVLNGRRVINAGNAKNLQDYVTKSDVIAAIKALGGTWGS